MSKILIISLCLCLTCLSYLVWLQVKRNSLEYKSYKLYHQAALEIRKVEKSIDKLTNLEKNNNLSNQVALFQLKVLYNVLVDDYNRKMGHMQYKYCYKDSLPYPAKIPLPKDLPLFNLKDEDSVPATTSK